MAYQYKESGLDNVFLENGYTMHKTPYGEGVSIKDTEGLHKLIGRWMVESPHRLNGAELRFLRVEMDLSQRSLAGILGEDEQAVRRWEKYRTKPVRGSVDRLIRALYNECINGDGSVRAIVDRLSDLDQPDRVQCRIREDHDHWRMADEAMAA